MRTISDQLHQETRDPVMPPSFYAAPVHHFNDTPLDEACAQAARGCLGADGIARVDTGAEGADL